MVDFDNETTIGTPAINVIKVLILQRRADLFEAWEDYFKKENRGQSPDLSLVKARIKTLYLELISGIKRRKKNEAIIKDIDKKLNSDSEKELWDLTLFFDNEMDIIRLTRIDTKSQYDSTRPEIENKMKNL